MGKRYVFWPAPDGKPYKGTDGKFAPSALLAHVGTTTTINAEGALSFPSFPTTELAIQHMAIVTDGSGAEINEHDARGITWDAVRAAIRELGGGKPIDAHRLLKIADDLVAKHRRQPPEPFRLITSLSIDSFPAKRVEIGDCTISPLPGRRGNYPVPEAATRGDFSGAFEEHLKSSKYQVINVETSGRTVHEATDKALDAVNLLRGLWTYFGTYGSWSMSFGSTRKPIGVIHAGPIHTLHKPDGSLAIDLYWYEPDYLADQQLFKPKNGWKKTEHHRRWAIGRIRPLPFARELESIIGRYVVALDNPNLDVAFLQMWAILEKITDTVGGRYDETIERATWVFSDRSIAKDLLEHLRVRRNRYVHAGRSADDREQPVYMIKGFVEPHILRLIRNDFKVASLKEYGEFLCLPRDTPTLKTRRAQLQRVIRMNKKKPSEI